MGIYCKGNKNKVRSKRMWASGRSRVKKEKEGEKKMASDSPRKRLRVWAGSKAAHPKGEREHWLLRA